MSENLKVAGIYNEKGFQTVTEEKVLNYGFDFRPRSSNFLQQRIFKDLIEQHFNHSATYFLHYQDEKDFIIFQMGEEIKKSLHKIGRTSDFLRHFILQFSDIKEASFYQSMPFKFIWEYQPLGSIFDIVNCDNNVGVAIPYSFLLEASRNGHLEEMVLRIAKVNEIRNNKDGPFKMILQVDWEDRLSPKLSDLFKYDLFEFSINSRVEFSYRNINCEKVSDSLSGFKKRPFQNI